MLDSLVRNRFVVHVHCKKCVFVSRMDYKPLHCDWDILEEVSLPIKISIGITVI